MKFLQAEKSWPVVKTRLFNSGPIARSSKSKPAAAAARLPTVQPLEYWKVCAVTQL